MWSTSESVRTSWWLAEATSVPGHGVGDSRAGLKWAETSAAVVIAKSVTPTEVSVSHANVRLNLHGRMLLVRRVRVEGRPVAHVAKEMGISRQCAHRWVARFDVEGPAGLQDRSSNYTTPDCEAVRGQRQVHQGDRTRAPCGSTNGRGQLLAVVPAWEEEFRSFLNDLLQFVSWQERAEHGRIAAFGHHPNALTAIGLYVRNAGIETVVASGVGPAAREQVRRTIGRDSPKSGVALCPETMSEGLNLQGASAIVHLDLLTTVRCGTAGRTGRSHGQHPSSSRGMVARRRSRLEEPVILDTGWPGAGWQGWCRLALVT